MIFVLIQRPIYMFGPHLLLLIDIFKYGTFH